jgi:hypothetical protein
VTLAVLVLLAVSAGCQRTARPAAGPAAAATDYRTLNKAELTSLLKTKLGNESVALTEDGPNHYKGTIQSPDGTATLPLEVTVEAERIVCETKTPAGSTRDTITPNAPVKSELLNVK